MGSKLAVIAGNRRYVEALMFIRVSFFITVVRKVGYTDAPENVILLKLVKCSLHTSLYFIYILRQGTKKKHADVYRFPSEALSRITQTKI